MSAGFVLDVRVQRGAFSLAVTLELEQGVVCVIGPNGAGKSTLLRAILGAVPAALGLVEVAGHVLLDTNRRIHVPTEQRRLAYLPQGYGLFPHRTVEGNLRFALACGARQLTVPEQAARLADVVGRFGLGPLLDRYPAGLSGGEQQRVALARALSLEPVALLLDEPLAALDPVLHRQTRADLGQEFERLALPTLVVTHQPADVLALADRVVAIEAGVVTQVGTPSALRDAPATRFVEAFFERG